MAVRFSKIWLLIGVVFTVQLPVTRGQLCPRGSTFHPQTGSCMALIRSDYSYINARNYCKNSFKSTKTNREGHLVFIFDKATDDFVKGLLDREEVDKALIGLHDRVQSGYYVWGDVNSIRAHYTGWRVNPHTPDVNKRAVVITKDGWQEYGLEWNTYFVCQVSADYPIPWMVCPAAEVGQQSPDIRCTIDTSQSLSITGVTFMKAAAIVASCNADKCWPGQGYWQLVDVSKPTETHSSVSWALKLRNVTISDETDWTCSVEFNNSGDWIASQPCSLNVYRKPADIQCSHQFVQSKVGTTCIAAQVYPRVTCSWKVDYGTSPFQKLTVYNQTLSNDEDNTDGYYRATCTASFYVNHAGIYDVTVAMVPTLPNIPIDAVIKTHSVSVELPQQPPKLYIDEEILKSSRLQFIENQTLSLTCQVPGGNPPVYRTIIKCNNIQQQSEGTSVTMDVRATREFNGRSCTCSALHAAGYTQTSNVAIRVLYPTTVTSFWISNYIRRGDQITFKCTATGNPEPQLTVQDQHRNTLTSSPTGDVTFQKTATCSDTGKYVCLASNMIQSQHYNYNRVLHLQVRCAPEHCNGMSNISFPAAVGDQPASIKICVRAYPAPTSFSLSKGNTINTRQRTDRYQVYFNFTNEENGLGEITVIISPFTQEDIGDYMVYSQYKPPHAAVEPQSYLTFSVFAQGPPACPTNFTLVKADPDSVTLAWIHGFNGGLNQTFEVFRIDSPNVTASPGFTMLETADGQGDSSVYAVTGLSESTTYTFGLEARNDKGTGNCSHIQVTVSTSASPSALSGGIITVVVAPIIIVLLLVILVVAVVVVVRRRRGHAPKKSVYMSETAPTGAGDPSRAGSSGAGDTSRLASDEHGEDNVYANSPGTSTENKNVKAAKKASEEENDSNTYALVNKQNKKAKTKAGESANKKRASEQGQSLYARFTRNINFKGHKKHNEEQVYNELAGVYQNVSNAGVPGTSAAADPDNVYANVKVSSSNKQEDTQEKKKNNYRTVNDDGLVYVSVEINKKTTYPEIISAKKPVGKVSPMSTNAEPEVEYIAINFSPGVKEQ